jgi:pyridoxamine 5'-phosphate oxidase family protein
MSFTNEETAYIRSQPLLRVATVSGDGQPDVVPVTFEFDGFHFYIGGYAPEGTRRTRNIDEGNDKVALVIDDLASVRPWSPRYVRVYGTVELVRPSEEAGTARIMKITPRISWSLNLSGEWSPGSGHPIVPRRTEHRFTETL